MINKILGKYVFKFVITFGITITLVFANSLDNTIARQYSFDLKEFLDGNHFLDSEDELIAGSTLDPSLIDLPSEIEDNYQQFKYSLNGSASHYAHKFHGRMTANGEIFDMNKFTCANKSLPFGTILKITNMKNKKQTFVRVNDRGPYVGDRIIDLSYKAAQEIDNMGVPQIKAEGFDRKKYTNSVAMNEEYFVAYSYHNDIKCVPSSTVKVNYETDNFTDAVKKYNGLIRNAKLKNAFLMVSAQYKRKQKDTYIIGSIISGTNIALN